MLKKIKERYLAKEVIISILLMGIPAYLILGINELPITEAIAKGTVLFFVSIQFGDIERRIEKIEKEKIDLKNEIEILRMRSKIKNGLN